ncbi:MAG: T9SS type A sorting domain-containing protein [Marinilabiliaceae bacterium]|nr:T9SS type A sorting domain-containing protein [Marinilabiliaceae bacterium]MBN2821162.1 T9SS type A sorting domain-containing protein [Bacteroidales bacterium]
MKRTPFIILSLILAMSISGFAQDCPCVKTAVIGNDASAAFTHNNKVISMPDTTILLGSSVNLQTLKSIGKVKWYALGSDTEITDLLVKPSATTEFVVKSELKDCPDAYDTVKIAVKSSATGLKETNVFSVFPNPTNGIITISSINEQIKRIEIVDINGKSSLQKSLTGENPVHEINISHLNNGMYFINLILTDNATVTKPIIKN